MASSSSSSSTLGLKLSCLMMLVCMIGMTLPLATEGIACGNVAGSLSRCLGYLQRGGAVSRGCCAGVRTLNSMASTSAARQQVCGCLKSIAARARINFGFANALPRKCRVPVPYRINRFTNCSKIR